MHMAQFDSRSMVEAAAATLGTSTAAPLPGPHRLAAAAEQAAAEPFASAMSPIVLAGAVRMIELALVALIGTAIYVAYVVPMEGIAWHYFVPFAAVSVRPMLAFRVAATYQVRAFPGHGRRSFRLA